MWHLQQQIQILCCLRAFSFSIHFQQHFLFLLDRISALGQVTRLLGDSQHTPVPSRPRGRLWVSSYWGVLWTDSHLYHFQIRPVHRNRYENLLPKKAFAPLHLSDHFPWGCTSKTACSCPSSSVWEAKGGLETAFPASVMFIQRFPVWTWEIHSFSLFPSPHGDYWDNNSHKCILRVTQSICTKCFGNIK